MVWTQRKCPPSPDTSSSWRDGISDITDTIPHSKIYIRLFLWNESGVFRVEPDSQSASSPSIMLTGRESLVRLIGKRRRFLPNRQSLLSAPIQVLFIFIFFYFFPCLVPGKISDALWNKKFAFIRPFSQQRNGSFF